MTRRSTLLVALTLGLSAAPAHAAPGEDQATLLPLWRAADADCRASRAGTIEATAACARRDHFHHRLARLGLCLAHDGPAADVYAWRPCGAGAAPPN